LNMSPGPRASTPQGLRHNWWEREGGSGKRAKSGAKRVTREGSDPVTTPTLLSRPGARLLLARTRSAQSLLSHPSSAADSRRASSTARRLIPFPTPSAGPPLAHPAPRSVSPAAHRPPSPSPAAAHSSSRPNSSSHALVLDNPAPPSGEGKREADRSALAAPRPMSGIKGEQKRDQQSRKRAERISAWTHKQAQYEQRLDRDLSRLTGDRRAGMRRRASDITTPTDFVIPRTPGWWRESVGAVAASDAHLKAHPRLILEGLIRLQLLPVGVLPELNILAASPHQGDTPDTVDTQPSATPHPFPPAPGPSGQPPEAVPTLATVSVVDMELGPAQRVKRALGTLTAAQQQRRLGVRVEHRGAGGAARRSPEVAAGKGEGERGQSPDHERQVAGLLISMETLGLAVKREAQKDALQRHASVERQRVRSTGGGHRLSTATHSHLAQGQYTEVLNTN
jgi:hypothetical protein